MNDFLQLLTQLPYILLISLMICIPLWTVVWAARDAEARGWPEWLVAPFVLLLVWPLGLVLWLLVRPERPSPGGR